MFGFGTKLTARTFIPAGTIVRKFRKGDLVECGATKADIEFTMNEVIAMEDTVIFRGADCDVVMVAREALRGEKDGKLYTLVTGK